jgi:glyoxylase-like metal-dependent hydrolase (beta-lactamase superfamily II)
VYTKNFVFLVVVLAAGAILEVPNASEPVPVQVARISDRVLVVRAPVGTNVTAINSGSGIVIVDTHLSPTVMVAMKTRIARELDKSDFVYVVNTHAHWDHCSGNQVFPDATILGHENTPVFMQHHPGNSPGTLWQQRSRLQRDHAKLESADPSEVDRIREMINARELIVSDLETRYTVTPPTVTFSDRYELDLGGVTLQLIGCGDTHSITDILVYVPEERVVMTGDVFCSQNSFCFAVNPLIDVPMLLDAMDLVLERGVDVVVPGHGDLMTGEDLYGLRERLSRKYAGVAARKSAAKSFERILAETTLEEAVRSFRELASDTASVGYLSDEEFYMIGSRMIDTGTVESATAVFELARGLFPSSPLICNGLAKAYLAAGDTLSAVAAFERGYKLDSYNRYAEAMLQLLRGE